MKKLNFNQLSILLLSLLVFTSSCNNNNNELTREVAGRLIKAKYNYPHVVDGIMETVRWDNDNYKPDTDKMINEGLIEITERVFRGFGTSTIKFVFTEKGKKYFIRNERERQDGWGNPCVSVITSKEDLGSVTGIAMQGDHSASVDYTVVENDISPFGRIIFHKNGEIHNKKAYFTKYDDGWRIER